MRVVNSRLPEKTLERLKGLRVEIDRLDRLLQELADTIAGAKVAPTLGTPMTGPGLAARRFDPLEAGWRAVEQMRDAEGGAWTGPELESRFKLSSALLHRRRKEHRIVHWRDAKHDFHYPKWQFTPSGALLPGVQEILQLFRSEDEWRVMAYFLGKRRQLEDRRPLDLLREGDKEKVLEHARIHAQENTW